MNKYDSMRKRQQDAFNAFSDQYMFYAFSDQQTKEGIKKVMQRNDLITLDITEIAPVAGGGYVLKSKYNDCMEMLKRHQDEIKAACADPDFAFDMFFSIACDHEYGYTQDLDELLAYSPLTVDEINANDQIGDALRRACSAAIKDYEECNL